MAGGHVWFVPGYGIGRSAQELAIARIRNHRVPLVLTDLALYDVNYRPLFPLVAEYVQHHYDRRGEFRFGEDTGVGVFVARAAGWTATDPATGLPCGSSAAAHGSVR